MAGECADVQQRLVKISIKTFTDWKFDKFLPFSSIET